MGNESTTDVGALPADWINAVASALSSSDPEIIAALDRAGEPLTGEISLIDILPSDDDAEIVDGMAKLELLRQMEDIEKLRE